MYAINSYENTCKEFSYQKFLHNIKNNLFVISSYIEYEEYDKARIKIGEICNQSHSAPTRYPITNNKIIDSFLNGRISHAKDLGINCRCNNLSNIAIPDMSYSVDMDICVAIGSAIDNSIDYLLKLDGNFPHDINIECDFKDNVFYCKVSNFIKDNVQIDNLITKTSKHDSTMHGFGIPTMIEKVAKHSGNISFNQENHMFSVTLSFIIPK